MQSIQSGKDKIKGVKIFTAYTKNKIWNEAFLIR